MHIDSAEHMENLGVRLARACPPQAVIYLLGDLGAGKTTLVRGFLRALGHAGAVKSPTYTLIEPYTVGGRQIYHLDLYRLGDAEELEYLGLRDFLDQTAVWLVEWPERGAGALPAADLRLEIQHAGRGRELSLTADSADGQAVLEALAHEHPEAQRPPSERDT